MLKIHSIRVIAKLNIVMESKAYWFKRYCNKIMIYHARMYLIFTDLMSLGL